MLEELASGRAQPTRGSLIYHSIEDVNEKLGLGVISSSTSYATASCCSRSRGSPSSQPKEAAFLLHQATERFYHCLFLVRTLYSPKTHNLNQLRQLTEAVEPSLKDVWPRTTKFERRCYELLREAYVKARYPRHYRISDEQLTWFSARVVHLQGIVRELCERRIADLSEAA